MDRDGLIASLEAAVLTVAEFAAGAAAWRTYPDPFESWDDPEPAAAEEA